MTASDRSVTTPERPTAERITVALVPKAAADLAQLQERTGRGKTDIINRAISLYEFADAQDGAGKDIIIRDRETGEAQMVRLL